MITAVAFRISSRISIGFALRALFAFSLAALLVGPIQSVSADSHGESGKDRLIVKVAPDFVPAQPGEHHVLSAQLVGPTGIPVLVSEAMKIRLFSSDPRVVSVDSEFEIPVGSSFVIAPIRTSGDPGGVTFTASADGVSPGHATLEVVEAGEAVVGTTLTMFAMPDRLIKDAPTPGRAMVAIVDNTGSPVAPLKDVAVYLTSSDPGVATVPGQITIAAGTPGTFVDITQIETGSVQLTAVADGFSSAGTGVEVFEVSDEPAELVAAIVPERWDHSGIANPLLVVQALATKDSVPAYLPCGIVFLASSNPDLLSVPGQVDVPCESDIASIEVPLVSTSGTGNAVITIATPGLVSTIADFSTQNRAPDELTAWSLPSRPAAGDSQSPVVVVQLVDFEGTPVAAGRPMLITVRVGDEVVEEVVQISTEQSFTAFPYSLISDSGDSADLWISSEGVSSVPLAWSNAQLPVDAVIEFSDPWRYQSEPVTATITVRVQGRLMPGALVVWDVEEGNAYLPSAETDENGQVTAEIRSDTLGQVSVTARILESSIDTLEVMSHFESVSLSEQSAPGAKFLGLPVGQLAWLVVILAIVVALFDFIRTGHLGPWGPDRGNASGDKRRGGQPGFKAEARGTGGGEQQPKSNLLRLLVSRWGRDEFPLPELPIFDQLDPHQLEYVQSEYAMKMGTLAGDDGAAGVPLQQRELIAGAAAVSCLERLTERQSQDGEYELAPRTAELALNAASHLNSTRILAGGDQLDRTRLWVLFSQALLNADRPDEAITAAQAALKTARNAGSDDIWAAAIGELASVINARIARDAGTSEQAA